MIIGRFAPSPSGYMHLGNVSVALLAWLSAKAAGGEVVLRIEDLDPARSRKIYADAIMDDLSWLGLKWDRRAQNQSLRGSAYEAALAVLRDLTYPCYCSRDELHAANAPHASDGRVVYPGTCRNLTPEQRTQKNRTPCLRVRVPDREIAFTDGLQGIYRQRLAAEWGDFIVRRSDGVAAYQLAVVVDDAANGVTEVVRGRDLLSATPAQLFLYEALGLKAPSFCHTPMLLAPDGARLSKRNGDLAMRSLRSHMRPEEVVGLLAWLLGLIDRREAVMPEDLIPDFSWSKVRKEDVVLNSDVLH